MEQQYIITSPYQTCHNGNVKYYEDKPEQIYCDPEIVTKNSNNEKYAVKFIMEKYDSLKCLNGQLDNLQISVNPDNSVSRDSLEDGNYQTEDNQESETNQVENGLLSEQDIAQIEVFFGSHKTYVYVCRCLANLYFSTVGNDDWGEPERTGIPVLLLDKGETRARNERRLQIVLAEKGSGFVLWKDSIDYRSNYKSQETFHTMYWSKDHRKMAGLSFDAEEASEKFLAEVKQLMEDPLNISLSVPKQKKKKLRIPKKKEKPKQLSTKEISSPFLFEHVTNVSLDDKKKLYSMATLVPTGEEISS
ncbi:uncharacterized protein [Parasteatoda tepidariorum]|uniref:uncharacterized protein n=1 Tax=Parasteatoda tepidariorum TaxID=114398 RepID=UPI00077FB8AB|nr:uncharacterized protein LOC107440216 [Parasteatoda tepidariorum]XP_015908561.1 uncharacterized protein LOC107440216 [Parasteatoda tepidariorum]